MPLGRLVAGFLMASHIWRLSKTEQGYMLELLVLFYSLESLFYIYVVYLRIIYLTYYQAALYNSILFFNFIFIFCKML